MEGLKTSASSSIPYVRDILEEHKLLFFLLTETWLRDQVDAELHINGYNLFRVDRSRKKKRRGRNSGGVAAYVNSEIAVDVILEYSCGVIEALCMHMATLNLVVCVTYRQPDDLVGGNRSTEDEFNAFVGKITEVVSTLPTPTPNIVLAGDFNLPHASWPSGTPKQGASRAEKAMIQSLTALSEQHFLTQINEQPSHQAGNILDLILTNCPDNFIALEMTPSAPISSHHLVSCTTLFSSAQTKGVRWTSKNKFDTVNMFSDETNWDEIRSALRTTSWTEELQGLATSEMLKLITDKCASLAQRCAPKRRERGKGSFIPRHRRILMRKRTRLRKTFHAQSNPTRKAKTKAKLVNNERELQESYKSQEVYDEAKAVSKIKTNSKYFFSYAKRKAKIHTPVGPLKDSMGEIINTPAEMANTLSQQYKSAFSNPVVMSLNTSNIPTPSIEDITFSEADIVGAIDEVSNNAAPGPDGFPAIMLKNCKHELAKPLYLLWRKSLDSGEVPDELKLSNIIPIHKGGNKQAAKNYRPVALTSHLVKVFEKVLRNSLVRFIEENGLMNPNQHGFRAGRSCLSQLLQHQDKITQLLEEGCNVDVVYLDFSRAFDKLDIDITLQKIHDMGITGKLFRWLQAFLTGRKQFVLVQGEKSEEVSVVSGVPQGSVIGPLMFLILLKYIDAGTRFSHIASFADDTRVLSGVSNTDDVKNLQDDLQKIYDWAHNNNARFNQEKFEALRYGPNDVLKQSTVYLSGEGTPINCSQHVKDLGVTLSHDASFTEHITNTTRSANLKCGWILRTFKTRDRMPLLTLWKSLIAPVLDYCCPLWSPNSPGLIQSLESVQSSFFNKITGMASLDYWEQLKALKMFSLQRRRERYICIYVWKVLEGLVPNFGLRFSHNNRRGRSCTMPAIVRAGSQRYQTIRSNSMGVMGPRLFNHLPSRGCSVDTFKRALDKHLDTIPDEPRLPKLVRYCSKGSNSILEYCVTSSQLNTAPIRLADRSNRLADHTGSRSNAAPSRLADHTGSQPNAAPSRLADHTGSQPNAAPSRLIV